MSGFRKALASWAVVSLLPAVAWGQFQITVSSPGNTGTCLNNVSAFNAFGWNNTVTRQSNFNASGPAFIRYWWDANPANRVFNGSEPSWQQDSLDSAPAASGPTMYLHLQAFNDNDNDPNNGNTGLYPGANANVTFGAYNMDVSNPTVASIAITPSPCVDTPATVALQATVTDPDCATLTRLDICLLGPNLTVNPGFSANGVACTPACPTCKVPPNNWVISGDLNMQKCNDYPNPGSQDGDGHWVGASAYEGAAGFLHTSTLSQQVFGITPGRHYVISVWASTGTSPNQTKSSLLYKDGAGPEILLDQYLTNTAGWQQLSNTVVPASNNITMILRLNVDSTDRSGQGGGQGGGGNFDNATIRECTNPDSYPAGSPAESANATWNAVTFNNPTSPVTVSATDSLGNTTIVDANISLNPRAATPPANPTICAGQSANLVATVGAGGNQIQWLTGACPGSTIVFTGASGATFNTGALFSTTVYSVRSRTSSTGCVSPCVQVTVTVTPTPVAPASAGVDRPTICSNSGGNIVLTASGGSGTTLRWYSGSCGGTLVRSVNPLTTPAPVSTTNYFARWETASCGNSACATQVTVTVNPAPVAPASASSSRNNLCSNDGGTITLTASGGSGNTLRWFNGACGGASIGSGASINVAAPTSTTTYFAYWESALCGNSTCASIPVTVNPAPAAPNNPQANPATICVGQSSTLSVNNPGVPLITDWFTGGCGITPLAGGSGVNSVSVSPGTTTTYFARTRNTASGCVSATCSSVTVTVTPAPPPTALCKNIAKDLVAPSGTVTVNASEVDNNSSASAACGQSITLREIAKGNVACNGAGFGPSVTFTCSDVGQQTVTLRMTQTDGQRTCCQAVVTVNAPGGVCGCAAPIAKCVANLTRPIAQPGRLAVLTPADIDNVSTAGAGCSLTSKEISKDGLNFGSTISYDCTGLGPHTVTLRVTQSDAQTAICTSQVTITDPQSLCVCPPPFADCKNITRSIQPGGQVVVNADEVNNVSFAGSGCTISSFEISRDGTNFFPNLTFVCLDVGAKIITLRVNQSDGKQATCLSTVTIDDGLGVCGFTCLPPNPVCTPVTVSLQGSHAFVNASSLDGGSSAGAGPGNCHLTSVLARRSGGGELGSAVEFICADAYRLTQATLHVVQDNGLSSECLATVTVLDDTAPQIFCPSERTPSPDPGTCVATNVDLGNPPTGDNCGLASLTNNAPATYGAGTTVVTWVLTDTSGNTATCTQKVTIEDTVPPTISCPGPVTVNVDTSPPGSCVAANVSLGTPTTQDNCPGVQTTNNKPPGGFPLGVTSVIWKATDAVGNSSTCKQDVTVNDPNHTCVGVCTDPIPQCKLGFTRALSGNNAVIAVADINDGSTPGTFGGCTITKMEVKNTVGGFYDSVVSFLCSDVGSRSVTLRVTQSDGKTAECSTPVTIVDNTPPVLFNCPSERNPPPDAGGCTVNAANVNLGSPNFADSCGYTGPFNDAPSVYPAGTTVVTWTVTDPSGNTATCKQNVVVAGTQPLISGGTSLNVQGGTTCPTAANQVALTATDGNPASLVWSVKTQGVKGTASYVGGNTGGSETVCYQPGVGQSGGDSFTVETTNSCGGKDDHTINVTITGGGGCVSPVTLVSAASRRTHGTVGTFDLNCVLSGTPTSEPRAAGTAPAMVLTFSGPPVDSNGGALDCADFDVSSNPAGASCAGVTVVGNSAVVALSGLAKNRCLTVAATRVCVTGDKDVSVVLREGDAQQNGNVNILDLNAIKGVLNQGVSQANARNDINVNGSINILDLNACKNNLNPAASCP